VDSQVCRLTTPPLGPAGWAAAGHPERGEHPSLGKGELPPSSDTGRGLEGGLRQEMQQTDMARATPGGGRAPGLQSCRKQGQTHIAQIM
jgi:hypothetical protein